MSIDIRRIRAVTASLRGIRERVAEHTEISDWDTIAYDNAVGLLDGAIDDADFTAHVLEQTEICPTEYLVHLDSLIAFLEVYENEGTAGSVVTFQPRQQG